MASRDQRRRVLGLRVVQAGSGEDRPDPDGTVVVVQHPDGQLQVLNPSPMAGLGIRERERLIVSLLEARALRGDLDAARAWLQHRRWSREMTSGKAAQRHQHQVSGRVVVVDDLGRGGAAEWTRSNELDLLEVPADHGDELPGDQDEGDQADRAPGAGRSPGRAQLAGLLPAPTFRTSDQADQAERPDGIARRD
jgi:hypothetical protein